MEFVLSSAVNATAEIAAADAYPHIRVVDGPQQYVTIRVNCHFCCARKLTSLQTRQEC